MYACARRLTAARERGVGGNDWGVYPPWDWPKISAATACRGVSACAKPRSGAEDEEEDDDDEDEVGDDGEKEQDAWEGAECGCEAPRGTRMTAVKLLTGTAWCIIRRTL